MRRISDRQLSSYGDTYSIQLQIPICIKPGLDVILDTLLNTYNVYYSLLPQVYNYVRAK